MPHHRMQPVGLQVGPILRIGTMKSRAKEVRDVYGKHWPNLNCWQSFSNQLLPAPDLVEINMPVVHKGCE